MSAERAQVSAIMSTEARRRVRGVYGRWRVMVQYRARVMAATFQMLAVQRSTSKEVHTWHKLRPSRHRRPVDSSLARLRGVMHQRCHEHVRHGRRGHQVMRHTVEGADAQDGDQDQEVPQESGRERQHQLRHHQPREDREGRLSTRQGGATWGQLDDPAGAWAAALGFGSQAKGDPGGGHREVSCFHGAGRAGSRLLGGDARAPGAQRGQGGCERRRGALCARGRQRGVQVVLPWSLIVPQPSFGASAWSPRGPLFQ